MNDITRLSVGYLIDLLANLPRTAMVEIPGDLELLVHPAEDPQTVLALITDQHPFLRFQYAEGAQEPGIPR